MRSDPKHTRVFDKENPSMSAKDALSLLRAPLAPEGQPDSPSTLQAHEAAVAKRFAATPTLPARRAPLTPKSPNPAARTPVTPAAGFSRTTEDFDLSFNSTGAGSTPGTALSQNKKSAAGDSAEPSPSRRGRDFLNRRRPSPVLESSPTAFHARMGRDDDFDEVQSTGGAFSPTVRNAVNAATIVLAAAATTPGNKATHPTPANTPAASAAFPPANAVRREEGIERNVETDVETDVFAPRDVPPSDASVKSDDRSSSSVHRFENTSFVVPATSRRSRTSASSPSRREGARGGKRWSAAEGSGSTSSCVRAGGAAGRGERGAGKAGRVARRARGKGAGQHMNRRGRRGRRRRARTSNMIIPASLSSQYSERMSSKAAWYFATPHPEEEATAAGSPLSPSRVWHACITASRHDSLSFPRHRPQFPTVCSNHTRVVSFADRTSTRCTSSRRQAPDSRAETDMLGRAPKTDRWERTFLDTSALNSSGFSKCRTFARISEKRVSPLSSPHTPRHVSGALRLDFVGRR